VEERSPNILLFITELGELCLKYGITIYALGDYMFAEYASGEEISSFIRKLSEKSDLTA
jgi:hypothetical protein